ncbi:hypothetical protein HYS48_00315 [Candidatus Woesearchaeota archaeon]|nr:hypothetical protein [Candidatus Woesearchaeota archaeon]
MPEQEAKQSIPAKRSYSVEIILMLFILALLIGSVVYFYIQQRTIGGKAIATPEEASWEVEKLIANFPMLKYFADGSKACIIVPGDGQPFYSFSVRKFNGNMVVQKSPNLLCDGEQQEDFILKYISFAALQDHAKDPSCKKMVNGGRGDAFWYWPSKLWPKGETPLCNAEFQEKYCVGIYYCIDPKNVPLDMLSCCSEENMQQELVNIARKAAGEGLRHNVRVRKVEILQ